MKSSSGNVKCFLILSITLSMINGFVKCAVEESDLFPHNVPEDSRFNFEDDDFIRHNFQGRFNFFNKTYDSVFISGNGQVSFGEGIRLYTPECAPSSTPMIMVYWADADNRVDNTNAKLLYRETTDRKLLRKASIDIFKAFPEMKGITLTFMFIVTWKEIPFYGAKSNCNGTSLRNNFQLVLTSDGIHSFAIMYYNKIEWTTGTASNGNCLGLGGQAAKAGFDYGDGLTLYTVPGSCGGSIINIPQTSNINEAGKWVFRIDSNLRKSECQEFDKQKLKLIPSAVSPFGNVPLRLEGPCVTPRDKVICVYTEESNEIEEQGVVTPDSKSVVCRMPSFNRLGRKLVTLKILRPNDDAAEPTEETNYIGYLYVVNDQERCEDGRIKVSFNLSSEDDSTISIHAEWDPSFLEREIALFHKDDGNSTSLQAGNFSVFEYQVDFILEIYDDHTWREFGVIERKIQNTGSYSGLIDKNLISKIREFETPELLTFSLSRSTNNPATRVRRALGDGIPWGKMFAGIATTMVNVHTALTVLGHPLSLQIAGVSTLVCKAWSLLSGPPPNDTTPCPPTRTLAERDTGSNGNFEEDKASGWLNFFHPGAVYSVRQRIPAFSGAGSQCVYDKAGRLMVGPMGGGTLDRYSPNHNVWKHFKHDVLPYLICCKLSGVFNFLNCHQDYYKKRPSDDGSNYIVPRRARAVGDPHITTFDGFTYTFNGVGEFWMVRMEDRNGSFRMQARMEQYISGGGVPMNASVFTTVAMEEILNGDISTVQVTYSNDQILVSINGENVEIEDDSCLSKTGLTINHNTFQVNIVSADDVRVTFLSGFAFTFTTVGPNEVALNILGIVDNTQTAVVEGLMGNCDDVIENDLRTPYGTILPMNSTVQDIHYQFGLKWMVGEGESIFTYLSGKSSPDYSKPDFEPNFQFDLEMDSIPQIIVETCEGNKECLFDYTTTGSEAVASGTRKRSVDYYQAVEDASVEIKMCSSVNILQPENGYISVSTLLIGGTLEFFCYPGYHVEGGTVNCTCASTANNFTWICNRENPFPVSCLPDGNEADEKTDQDSVKCEAPPTIKNGYAVGTNYSVGATVEFLCNNQNYHLFWKNCEFNGEVGICKEHCNVTYTCVEKEITLEDGSKALHGVWEGFAGDIKEVVCYSDIMGKIATSLRATSLLVHAFSRYRLVPDEIKDKPYLIGC